MDIVGTLMAFVTIPMAILTLLSGLAAIALLLVGPIDPVLSGVLACVIGVALVFAIDRLTILLDSAAVRALHGPARGIGHLVGTLSGVIPVVALLTGNLLCLRAALPVLDQGGGRAILVWLLSYGVATAPWTVYALVVGHDRRTVCGIRAYAGHLSYWTLSLLLVGLHAPLAVAVPLMAWPMILPLVVGTLLATADRDALKNVRI